MPAAMRLAYLGWALDVALIAVASVVIFIPSARNAGLKDAVSALWMIDSGLGPYMNWKAGLLTKTPRQLFDSILISGPPKRRRFEHLAFFRGLVGTIVASWL